MNVILSASYENYEIFNANDLPDALSNTCKLYADDNKVIAKVDGALKTTTLQNDIDLLVQWSHDWLINLNFEKCHIVHFGCNNPGIEYKLVDNGVSRSLKTSVLEKDVDIFVSDDLMWENK